MFYVRTSAKKIGFDNDQKHTPGAIKAAEEIGQALLVSSVPLTVFKTADIIDREAVQPAVKELLELLQESIDISECECLSHEEENCYYCRANKVICKAERTTLSMSQKHTPGPWRLRKMRNDTYAVYGEGEYDIIFPTLLYAGKTAQANAALIVAAPELWEAAIDFVDKVESGRARSKDSYAKFKAAIKKVETTDD